MNRQRFYRSVTFSLIVMLLAIGTACTANRGDFKQESETLNFEIVENGTRFAPDEAPVFDDGLPAYGAAFITEGYIYPAGTLTCADNECNGVLEDGSPEFPDKVLGTWTCRGWHVGDGSRTTTGPWVVTTQLFDLGTTPGAEMIVTDGFEYSDFNKEFQRAITGGTGEYASILGTQTQELLGWNTSFGVALHVDLELRSR